MNLLTGMFGGGGGFVEKADLAVEKLQGYKETMVRLFGGCVEGGGWRGGDGLSRG